jgi:hypothetical protein
MPSDIKKRVIDVLALVSALLAVLQFFAWDFPLGLKIFFSALAAGACWLAYGPKWKLPAAVGLLILGVVAGGVVILVQRPSAAEAYADEYLGVTTSAHIWSGGAELFPGARECLIRNYDALEPSAYHYEREMPGARVVELSSFVDRAAWFESDPIVVLGRIIRSEPGAVPEEYVIQVAPMTEAQRLAWRADQIGKQSVSFADGSLDDLYPLRGIDDSAIGGIMYVRVRLRPLDLPIDDKPIAVRGCPITYGGYPARSGRNLDAVYIAGSSARIDE